MFSWGQSQCSETINAFFFPGAAMDERILLYLEEVFTHSSYYEEVD